MTDEQPHSPTDTPPNDGNDTPADEQPSVALSLAEVFAVLEQGQIQDTHGMMRYSSNYTFLITVQKDELCIPAIYKPRKGERPLWDFPEGTLYKRELAAYLTSEALGWSLVPPTVIKDGQHGVGSVQFYIDHDPEMHYFNFPEGLEAQLARLSLFDVLINNADRKGGHCLLDEQGQLWGIDHGISFNEDHKLRTVIWDFAGQPVPAPLIADVQRLDALLQDETAPYTQALAKLINPLERGAFQRRIARVLETGKYPLPGNGPNYPWPAV